MKLRHTLAGHEGQLLCARFDPEGKRVVTGGRDKRIIAWRLRGAKLERELVGHERGVSVLAFCGDEELLSGDLGGCVRLWSWPKGKPLLVLDEPRGPIYTLGSSADGSLLAAGAGDQTICVWSRDDGELLHRFEVGERGTSFVFSADGEYLVSGRAGAVLCFWSLASGELAWEQDAGPGTVGAFELSRDREWVVSRGWRGPVTLWSTQTWGYAAVLPIIEKGLGGATLRPGHEQVVCIYEGGIAAYDAVAGRRLERCEIPCRGIYDVDVSPDGRFAVTASADELGRVFEFEDIDEGADASEEQQEE